MQYVCGQMSRAALYKEPVSRLPAAASCLGRHAHPAGRSPNSSSLFLPLAAVVAVAVRIHPCSPFCKTDKTETPVPGSDTGVLGGRGWIRTSSTITIRWMRFEIVMDSCAFFEFHQKSIIGYHNHLGTKTGYKVGYFARGEYSARASETAIAAVSALPSTA